MYVSDHPLFGAEAALKRKTEHSLVDLPTMDDRAAVVVGGVITNLARKFTKKGEQMAVFVLEDLEASIEATVFPRTLREQGHKLEDDVIVAVRGLLDKRDESAVRPHRQRHSGAVGAERRPGRSASPDVAQLPPRRVEDPDDSSGFCGNIPVIRWCRSTSAAARFSGSPMNFESISTERWASCAWPSGTTRCLL